MVAKGGYLRMVSTDKDDGSDGEERNARRANPMDAHVGSRVRLRRMLLGMSQERLGEQLGLTFQQVQKYEKGVNRIGASRLFELAQVLSVPIQYFYDDAPSPAEGGGFAVPGMAERSQEGFVIEFLSSREGLDLNKAFVRIVDPKVRRAVVDLVKTLASENSGGS